MRSLVRVAAGAFVLLMFATPATAGSFTYSDGICAYRVRYDPTKIDGARLKATFVYLNDATPPLEFAPSLATADDVAKVDVTGYLARCTAHRRKLESLHFVDVAGIEALRKQEIGDLDATCQAIAASLAAAKGDVQPARAMVPACVRYADLLALPVAALRARWNDLVLDLCQTSTEVNQCAGQLQRDGEGPGSESRRRLAVVARWKECAFSGRLEATMGADSPADREKRRIKDLLAKRFRAKTLSCAQ